MITGIVILAAVVICQAVGLLMDIYKGCLLRGWRGGRR